MQQYLQNKKELVQNVFDQVYDQYDNECRCPLEFIDREKNLINMMNPSVNNNLIDVAYWRYSKIIS